MEAGRGGVAAGAEEVEARREGMEAGAGGG